MATLPKRLDEFRKNFDLVKEDFWDCHGTWVLLHAPLEKVAAKAGVTYDDPVVIEADTKNKTATIMMRGHLPCGASEVTFGEASPANCKNSYPWAMAEKRAKDRLVLKLVGLHGSVYSVDEADWQGKPPAKTSEQPDETSEQLVVEASGTEILEAVLPDAIKSEITQCATKKAVRAVLTKHNDVIRTFPAEINSDLKAHRDEHMASLAA